MSTLAAEEVTWVPVERLLFDEANPRLHVDNLESPTQQELFDLLWRDFAVDEIAASIAANGYFVYEPMFAFSLDSHFVVIEGNRRLAAVKALLGELDAPGPASSLPHITKAAKQQLRAVPVRVTAREDIWQYIGFKHVNGPQAWQSASKADYVAWVHNSVGVPLADISAQIGDKHSTVQRLYRALMVVEQAEETGVWHRSDRSKGHFSFSHLYTGLDYSGIADFIKVKPAAMESRTPVPRPRVPNLGELCIWLFGSRSLERQPIVRSQNPDLRRLDKVLQSPDAVAALRKGLPLEVSEDIARGDQAVLRESLVSAKNSLQLARGRVLTGYEGEQDLLKLASDVTDLAERLFDEMQDIHQKTRRRPRRLASRDT